METQARDYFDRVIELAETTFEQVQAVTDVTPDRQILRLQAQYQGYRIFITELFSEVVRKYRYYILQDQWVEAGFDNSPDPRAIRLKYGRAARKHVGENIPHLHQADKTKLVLTEEMTFEKFVEWVKDNIGEDVGQAST